ncbi:DUF1793-domain-containing protein [Cryphonectria parasitica EP155]|uniref:DUF1793-domain-containing protein n=1 Tax=Cryphonectria parasitica (strain ATCC 38755 / EP155) TaxID=660469 RepID=A0A9P4XUD3_CRYP1|nr:DUF1793-domain-containing protein [Cryphonectria parasitica EP155]KAF3760830.1 DUF1793-domain-containing protein [Cryphonectria parasitica EP155]
MHPTQVAATAAALFGGISQAIDFSPARPPAWPLAVRSPYLSTWLDGTSGGSLAGNWPTFWNGQVTALQGFVAVDGEVFNWAGAAAGPSLANQTSATYTSTSTVFTFDVLGKVTLTATFLSPVYPNDLVKQSLQYSYIDVAVVSSDGDSHDVQIYADVTGEWASGYDNTLDIVWSHGSINGVSYHTFNLTDQEVFVENDQQAGWGTWFFSTADDDGLTWQIAEDTVVRPQFESNQTLLDTEDTNYRAIDDDWPTFGFAKDLGSVSDTSASVLFTIGLSQEAIINFAETSSTGNTMTALWLTEYDSGEEAMAAFYNDYSTAVTDSAAVDSQVSTDSSAAGGSNLTTITSLAVRQVFGAVAPGVGTEQTYLFMKEISSDGDTNTADVIYPAMPILLYFNETLLKLLLDPLYVNQESGLYPNTYAEHDLGVWPNALGYPEGNDEEMPLEECGNMLIMTLAYAQRSGDTDYLSKHFPKLEQWAGYLVNESLIPANQISTDDFAGSLANQTNLALKGIIALKAMGQMGELIGNSSAKSYYGGVADDYLPQWVVYGLNNDSTLPHTMLNYNNQSSWGNLYNLYADSLLGLDFVYDYIYTDQSNYYPTVVDTYGLPLDTRHDWVKGDWMMFSAAIAESSTQSLLIDLLAYWIENTSETTAFGDLWDGETSGYVTTAEFKARPVMGGSFALLVLSSS